MAAILAGRLLLSGPSGSGDCVDRSGRVHTSDSHVAEMFPFSTYNSDREFLWFPSLINLTKEVGPGHSYPLSTQGEQAGQFSSHLEGHVSKTITENLMIAYLYSSGFA